MIISNKLLRKFVQSSVDEANVASSRESLSELKKKILDAPDVIPFSSALRSRGFGLIAEIKYKSPSMAFMRLENVENAALAYENCSLVKAVSILTNFRYFGTTIHDLAAFRKKIISKPILRKDFIKNEYQIYQSRAYGADAVLLMTQVLDDNELHRLGALAKDLGLGVLFECRTEEQIQSVPSWADIYGINSREIDSSSELSFFATKISKKISEKLRLNKKDRTVSPDAAFSKINKLPPHSIKVAESGITPENIKKLVVDRSYDAALVGASLLLDECGVEHALDCFHKKIHQDRIMPYEQAVSTKYRKVAV